MLAHRDYACTLRLARIFVRLSEPGILNLWSFFFSFSVRFLSDFWRFRRAFIVCNKSLSIGNNSGKLRLDVLGLNHPGKSYSIYPSTQFSNFFRLWATEDVLSWPHLLTTTVLPCSKYNTWLHGKITLKQLETWWQEDRKFALMGWVQLLLCALPKIFNCAVLFPILVWNSPFTISKSSLIACSHF